MKKNSKKPIVKNMPKAEQQHSVLNNSTSKKTVTSKQAQQMQQQ